MGNLFFRRLQVVGISPTARMFSLSEFPSGPERARLKHSGRRSLGLLALFGIFLSVSTANARGESLNLVITNNVVGQPLARVMHIPGATEGYDALYDGSFLGVPWEAIDFYSAVPFSPYQLSKDARPPTSFSTVTFEIWGRDLTGAVNAYLRTSISDPLGDHGFTNKNINLELYNITNGVLADLMGAYNARQLATNGTLIPLTVTNGHCYDLLAKFTPINNAPIAQDWSAAGNKLDSLSGFFLVSDADGDALQVFLVSPPAFGSLTVTNGTNWVYSPQGFAGTNSVPFYAQDPSGARSGTNTLELITTNRPPVAGAQSVTNLAESATAVGLSGSDPDGDALGYAVSSPPLHGALTGGGSNVVYTSANNYYGPDSFGFVVSDGSAMSAVAAVSVTVEAWNRLPVVSGIARAGTNVAVSAQVQPNRTTLPQAANALGGGWSDLSGLAQSPAWSTNLYEPAVFTIPLGTNGAGYYRLKSFAP